MKLFSALVILVCMSTKLFSTEVDSAYKKLVNCELVEESNRKEFEELTVYFDGFSNSTIVEIIYFIEFKTLTSVYPGLSTHINFGTKNLKRKERKEVNLILENYLDKLFSCELINTATHSFFQEKIKQNKYTHILQMIPEIVDYFKYIDLIEPENILTAIERINPKVIFGDNYDTLCSDIKNSKIKSPIQLWDYMNFCAIINEDEFSNKNYLEEIHKKTASIFNELSFSDFRFNIELDDDLSDKEFKFYNLIVSLSCNGREYKQTSFYELKGPEKAISEKNYLDEQEYYKIFNKVLADIQSKYRLHLLSGNSEQKFGIVALTEKQAEIIRNEGGTYFQLSYEDYAKGLNSKEIEEIIKKFQKIGLLNHLEPNELDKSKEKISRSNPSSNIDVLWCFPNVIFAFDSELSNLENPYEEIIQELAKISQFEFDPCKISDDFDIEKNKKVAVEFSLKNTSYKEVFTIESDWIDYRFIEFIEALPEKHQLNGKFYFLDTQDQLMAVIFLTEEQYKYLFKENIIKF